MSGEGPGVHPDPPADLAKRELPIAEVSEPLWRIYQNKYDNPLFFGDQATYRFDAPDRRFGVCYCACDEYGAVVETFGHTAGVNLLTYQALENRNLVEVGLNRPLQLVDLRGSGLKGIGADGRLIVGGDYSMARRWSKALHDHPQEIDGIWYRARNDPDRLSVAVYNRAAGVLEMVMEWKLASSAGLQRVLPIIDYYEFGIG